MQTKFLFHCAKVSAASVLIVGLSFAQSSQTTTARKSGSIVVTDRQSAREAGSGMATGRRQYSPTVQTIDSNNSAQRKNGAIHSADFPRSTNARNSAHATESRNQPTNAAKGDNPLYEDHGKSGTNPLFESGKVAKPNASTSGASGYKDPEDMTTRKAGVKPELGPDDAAKKHIAGVKYEDGAAAGQQPGTSTDNGTFKQDFGQVQASKR